MSEPSLNTDDPAVALSRPARAYARLLPEMMALPVESLQQIHANIPYAVTSALGAVPEIIALRPRVVDEMPKFPIEMLDNFEDAALALGHADTVHTVATRKPEDVPLLVERATRKCALLRSDLSALALRNIIDGAPLEQLRGGPGHRNIAFDLFALAHLARMNWPAIEGRSALTLAEIGEAEREADQLATALGLRQQVAEMAAPSAEMRERAFNLFIRYREQAERVVRFFFPKTHQDVLPSIHTPRGPSKKDREAPPETGTHPVLPAATPQTVEGEAEAEPADVGMPGASPYLKANG